MCWAPPTLGQTDGLGDLESVNSAQVPTGVQRDGPGSVLDVAVAGGHAEALDVHVSGAVTQGGPAWGGRWVKNTLSVSDQSQLNK